MPTASELELLLDQCRPLTVLEMLADQTPDELALYKAQALLYVDRTQEAAGVLEPVLTRLVGEERAKAGRLWAQVLLRRNEIDNAIFATQSALDAAVSDSMRVRILTLTAAAYCH